mgnify:CR=1 FL=1
MTRTGWQTIRLEARDGVSVITLDRPAVRNALNARMRAEITRAVADAGTGSRAVVLTGAGGAFCSGQDLGASRSLAETDLERTLRDEYLPMISAIRACPVPVIAAVNGAAAGAGASLALAADLTVAAESAMFSFAFTRIGLIPDAGASWTLPRLVGPQRAMGAMLLGHPIPAAEAERWGMIYAVLPDDGFETGWRALAGEVAAGPGLAHAALKEAMTESAGADFDTHMLTEARLQGNCGRSRDFREGVLAFLEKRSPHFEGR